MSKSPSPENSCPKCLKENDLCICDLIESIPNHLHVLILQHPQEPDKTLGSARIANMALQNSTLKVGLSWPNLSKALGRQAANLNWGVLYLGGKSEGQKPGGKRERIQITTKRGDSYSIDDAGLEGIVVLDGTWSQAKTLWWRNAWLLKLKRLVLAPQHKSMYGELRREPRKECLSTIEAIAETLEALGEDSTNTQKLRGYFGELLKKYRASLAAKSSRNQDSSKSKKTEPSES